MNRNLFQGKNTFRYIIKFRDSFKQSKPALIITAGLRQFAFCFFMPFRKVD